MATRTQSTVVAVFSDASDAQAAAEELEATRSVKVRSTSILGIARLSREMKRRAIMKAEIAGWFKRMFGSDDESDRPSTRTP